jgi:hypothetical protein
MGVMMVKIYQAETMNVIRNYAQVIPPVLMPIRGYTSTDT